MKSIRLQSTFLILEILFLFSSFQASAETLTITHNSGFFSCCSVHLEKVIHYFKQHKRLPDNIDSSKQFLWYKQKKNDTSYDIKHEYFTVKETEINYSQDLVPDFSNGYQFKNYKLLDYKTLNPFVDKYFSPSPEISSKISEMEKKYNLNYDNLCVLFYRGNDKLRETNLPSYKEFINKAKQVQKLNPNVVFLIQSDETEFLRLMKKNFPNSVIFYDEIRHMKKQNSTVDHVFSKKNHYYSKYYVAITYIMSKCKHIVCTSGNCSLWIVLFRGNSNNVDQYLSLKGSKTGEWL